jgi:cell division protein FtsQ
VHPRVAERLAVVASERARRRRRRAIVALALVSLLSVGGLVVLHSPLLGLRTLAVEGASGVERAAVVAASGINLGEPLADISAGAVEARVDRLADVRSVAVRREWPHTVVLVVHPHRPVAVLAEKRAGGLVEEVDRAGRVIDLASTAPVGLPVLAGVTAAPVGQVLSGRPLRRAVEIAAACARELPAAIARQAKPVVEVAPRSGAVTLVVDGTVKVRLGGLHDLDTKVRSLAVVLARVPLARVSEVDLADPELPALTPG